MKHLEQHLVCGQPGDGLALAVVTSMVGAAGGLPGRQGEGIHVKGTAYAKAQCVQHMGVLDLGGVQ